MRVFLRHFAAALIISTAFTSCATTQAKKDLVGTNAGDVLFQDLEGTQHILDEFKGKTVVLVFWAQWCSRSRSSITALNDLARKSAGRSDRVFIAVNIDKLENEGKFKDFIREANVDSFLHAYSGNDVHDQAFIRMDGEELPHIFIIDPLGVVREVGHSDKFVYEYFKEMK